jgi:hypothetical protein
MYVAQSDPQNFSAGKKVIMVEIDDCVGCDTNVQEEVIEAQRIMGRLGVPKKEEKHDSNG